MDSQGIDQIGPTGSTSGIVAEDIIWAFGISVAVLGLVPVMAIYVLLIA
ncbi:MAG: hypothetical protein J0H40_06185 [Rhizobiales bacterium]|nr:hypothetical protein [Hyphomicrobiales bacterium]